MSTKTWDDGTLLPCTCGADDWQSLPDTYAHFDNWEHFKCGACGRSIKLELPDG